jgi:hypothetical protein
MTANRVPDHATIARFVGHQPPTVMIKPLLDASEG